MSTQNINTGSKQSIMMRHEARFPTFKMSWYPCIPDLPFVEPEPYKKSISTAGKTVLLTFGLLSFTRWRAL